jgi:glycosyltransferase involved in cell wall biosynthesis
MQPIAFVIPWFGADLKGGAEQHAFQIATRLAARGHEVELLTTCCRSFLDDWSVNHLPAGDSLEHGLVVRRFPVRPRDTARFDAANGRLLALSPSELKPGVCPVTEDIAQTFCDHNIHSPDLVHELEEFGGDYLAVVFIPYLYGPILAGLAKTPGNAFLQPCLHDECYAYLPQVESLFRQARACLFNSEGEYQLALKLYGPGLATRSHVTGGGVETIVPSRRPENPHGRYVLYLGRRDATKNVDRLIEAWAGFRDANPESDLRLLLAGPGVQAYVGHEGVTDLGLVNEETKTTLLANALALFQPSRNESYSRVLMEAWMHGRPVAAHRECIATAGAVAMAKGGWVAGNEEEWAGLFAAVDQVPATVLDELGSNGRSYAVDHADWDQVIDGYESILGLRAAPARYRAGKGSRGRIDQVLPQLSYGDAISNHALWIRDQLHALGFESEIRVGRLESPQFDRCVAMSDSPLPVDAGVIYHHSIGSEVTRWVIAHRGPKALIYHNITPDDYFRPWRPEFADLLARGRRDLGALVDAFPVSVGVSAYNAGELAASGFALPGILSLAVSPVRWNIVADPSLMASLQDGKRNLMFAGRLAPNKCQHELVEAFALYLELDPAARLILVGAGTQADPYGRYVLDTIDCLGLRYAVLCPGHISEAELAAYYRTAHLFWSMSEHEGFCAPIIEAMWFGIPVLAFKSSVIPETLQDAGLMFTSKRDLLSVAAVARAILTDEALRSSILVRQNARRQAFLPEAVAPQLEHLIDRMMRHSRAPADRVRPAVPRLGARAHP